MKNEGPRIAGAVHPATTEGFRKFLQEANRVERDGYELIAVVPLGPQIGAVFRRRKMGTSVDTNNSFFE
jgi:hypothetical protein